MKKVAFIFPPRAKDDMIKSVRKNFEFVFGDKLTLDFLKIMNTEQPAPLYYDLYLLPAEFSIYQSRNQISDLRKVLSFSRTLPNSAPGLLKQIPPKSRVLVVNDTDELTLELANVLLHTEFDDIEWIPYFPTQHTPDYYKNIEIAVTPNEMNLVPPHIKYAIDIGERFVDIYSMLKIIDYFQLKDELVLGRLFQYSQLLAETESGISSTYFRNYMKEVLLRHYTQEQADGVLLFGADNRLIYANQKMTQILAFDLFSSESVPNDWHELQHQLVQDDFSYDILTIHGENYAVTKRFAVLGEIQFGYWITFRDEKSVYDTRSDFRKKRFQNGLNAKYNFHNILHNSENMKKCIQAARKAAATDYSVLIEGESGTGKELLAQSIHNASMRRQNPFVAINCASMPETLLSSELFGYEGGAFTGAKKNGKPGLFEQADGGTLFLDEIGDMPPSLQALLLRALQEKQIMRVGGEQVISVDVRIIAATNKSLSTEVERKNFRADLFYRLNILPISVPSLRNRKKDILLLLKHFLGADYSALTQKEKEFLEHQSWPGNIRQLENFSYYYKTMRTLDGFFNKLEPDSLLSTFEHLPAVEMDALELPLAILSLIQKHSTFSHGIGRLALLERLRGTGLKLTDGKLRLELTALQQSGYITISRGRTGCQITPSGVQRLKEF